MKKLNPQQFLAVRHTEGPLLILAGAGSGKTQVITTRIVHLIKDRQVPAENILAVTFTNKAAREMRERVASMAGKSSEGIIISTFHSLGVRILRRDIRSLGFKPNFSIYSSSDQAGVLRQAMRERNIDPKQCDPDSILWRISGAKNRLVGPYEFKPTSDDRIELATASVYPRYQELLKGFNAIDFDDIIMLSVKLLQSTPAILEHWQKRFSHIMVDEYQDTNASQYLLISLLAKLHGNLCVVGDDDQSIYGWRGAEVRNILNFEHDHAGCRVIKLEQNYRSTSSILDAANSVIKNNQLRTDKALWTALGKGREIDLIVAGSEEDEAAKVVESMLMEQFRDKLSWSDLAILYRSNSQSRAFEEKLRQERIPYVVIGGQQFYERKEVKDAIAYLKVIDNPSDEASLLRIINFPRRGIGDNTLVRLNQWSLEHDLPLFQTLARVRDIPDISESSKKAVEAFHAMMRGVMEGFKNIRMGEQVNALFNRLRIEDELYRTLNDASQARKRIENIEQVVNSLAVYEEQNPKGTLSAFLERISLLDEDKPNEDDKEHGRDAVTLMSLHSSKGLEFSHVFLVGMEEDLLPHKRSIEEDPTVAEERRLCYVGITRARRHLTISRCRTRRKYGAVEQRNPSRFLDEIPEHLLNSEGGEQQEGAKDSDSMAADFFAQMLGENSDQ
ncbi:ATP-dependent helicase [Pelobacter propionicus]|uniref:DNA 3'-5' helicase n=1 Tax=Pelobacter propionicus (strain DSM 2379 / NBRC 103807 / OttBd1) TaxID=338966 RepID=A1AS21_PELPD|nr:UvrD-helicase domain-containing protein [Pelobacter propionicus]ABL00142.1 UvrD/REP helicase [Pelobacter propionicus DSM 2379]